MININGLNKQQLEYVIAHTRGARNSLKFADHMASHKIPKVETALLSLECLLDDLEVTLSKMEEPSQKMVLND